MIYLSLSEERHIIVGELVGELMKIKSRHELRSDAARKLIDRVRNIFGEEVERFIKKKKLELVKGDDGYDIILVDGEPLLTFENDEPVLTVRGAFKIPQYKKMVTIDAGAVKFICSGADVMRPGIVKADHDIKENDIVIVVDETHGKPLAVGRALMPGNEMVGKSGKAVRTIHYVGDPIWNFKL